MSELQSFYFQSYAEWHQAITERCRIDLTPDYARSRIDALRNPEDPATREFASKYGNAYLDQVVRWFEMAEQGSLPT
ncbi:MAG: hypothetical protein AAGI24_00615 [Pseudomonadota bacterium]